MENKIKFDFIEFSGEKEIKQNYQDYKSFLQGLKWTHFNYAFTSETMICKPIVS